MPETTTGRCPCGTGAPYGECCARHHAGTPAPTAEALMRARYSAYATGDPDYLLATWHASSRPARLVLDPERRWTRLEVVGRAGGGLFDDTARVAFRAHSERRGRAEVLAEDSRFVREGGRWLYVDGE